MAARAHWFEDERRLRPGDADATTEEAADADPRNERLNDRSRADGGDAGPERTCVLTRACRPKDELIRLALSPDGKVAPDVRARAPGRGAWIGVGRAALDAANAKGKLKGALARAFKTQRGRRSRRSRRADRGCAAPGRARPAWSRGARRHAADRCRADRTGRARTGKVHLLIHAADAGEDGNRSARPGAGASAAAARRGAWSFPNRAPSCRWRWDAKMWYMSR